MKRPPPLAVAIVLALAAGFLRERLAGGLEARFLALALLLAPHVESVDPWAALLTLASLASLVVYPVASLGPWLALLALPLAKRPAFALACGASACLWLSDLDAWAIVLATGALALARVEPGRKRRCVAMGALLLAGAARLGVTRPLAVLGLASTLPIALAEGPGRWSRALERVLVTLAASVGVLVTLLALVDARRSACGFDFFYYACNARDLALDGAAPAQRYVYFPGVYTFWGAAIAGFGDSLPHLRCVHVAVVATVAGLAGVLVARLTASGLAGLVAAIAYVTLGSRLELFEGTTEPLATIPVLAALLAWGGRRLEGRSGVARALALGTGLGLACYAKQQGGLLALGGLALLGRGARREVLLVPIAAALTLGLAVAAEGNGLEPLRAGLAFASGYGGEGSFGSNLLAVLARSPAVAALGALTALTLPAWAFARRSQGARPSGTEAPLAVGPLATLAALATLGQLARRAYAHYLLLGLPFALVGVFALAGVLVRRSRNPALVARAAFVLAAAVLLVADGEVSRFASWPPVLPRPSRSERWECDPEVARDLALLAPRIARGATLVVLPPHRNELLFLLGARARACPYGYFPPPLDEVLRDVHLSETDAVVTVPGDWANTRGWWGERGYDRAVALLVSHGFVPVATWPSFTLWRR